MPRRDTATVRIHGTPDRDKWNDAFAKLVQRAAAEKRQKGTKKNGVCA